MLPILSLISAILVTLALRSIFSMLALQFQSEADPLLERLLYLLVYIGPGALLFFLIIPRLLSPPGQRLPTALPSPWKSPSPFLPWNGKRTISGLVAGILTGPALYLLLLGVLTLAGQLDGIGGAGGQWIRHRMQKDPKFFITMILATAVLTPIAEEIYYRWILPSFLALYKIPILWILVFQGVLFGVNHNLASAPFIAFTGLVFGVLAYRYGFFFSILAHSGYNLAILLHTRWIS